MTNDKVISFNEHECYFLAFETIGMVDIFVRPVYKQIIVHTLNHFIDNKGFIVYGWCLMPHGLSMVCQADKGLLLGDIRKGFKQFTSEKIMEAILTEPDERKEWLQQKFIKSGGLFGNTKKLQCWKIIQSPLLLDKNKPESIAEQIEMIHYLPVRDRIVQYPGEYIYSSARDYEGSTGLVKITKLTSVEQEMNTIESRKSSFRVKYNRY